MTKWLRLFAIGCSAALAASWASPARAGVRVESKISVGAGKSIQSVLELQGDRFRINLDDPETGKPLSSTIFDGQRIVRLQPSDKTYTVMTLADLKAQMGKLDQFKASLPPEAQARLDKEAAAPVFAFKRTPGGETIAGISCENYAMSADGTDAGTTCLAVWKSKGPVTKADLAPMIKLAEETKSLHRLPTGDLQMGPEFDKWPGWPLVNRDPKGVERTRVVKVSRPTIAKGEFETPSDYTEKPAPTLGGAPTHP